MNDFPDHLREQMLRYLDGTLNELETHELGVALKSSSDLRREFAELLRQQVQLGELGTEQADKIVPLPATSPPLRWNLIGKIAAIAACLALLVSLALWLGSPIGRRPAARFTQVAGEVWIQHGDVQQRATISSAFQTGDTVQTGFGGAADIKFTDEKTHFHLREETVLSWAARHPQRLALEHGIVEAKVAPQPQNEKLTFATPQGEASVLGTELQLATDATSTHLSVIEGRVQLRGFNTGEVIAVPANQWAVLAEGAPLVAHPLPPNGSGTGLLGEYFPWGNFTTPTFGRIDPQVQFDWGTGRPGRGLNEDHFQVRWSGTVQPKFTERYIFELVADDGVRLWVDGQLLIDQWVIRSRQTKMRGEISLSAGRQYPLKLEYFESSGKAFVSLYWQSDSQPREIIPATQLYPPATNQVSSNKP